jgi:hypothetical protein
MKILSKSKDGGDESTVWAYTLIEIKPLFSIILLKFVGDSREAYHNHAFNSFSWLLKGKLIEKFIDNTPDITYNPSLKPIVTKKETFHKVSSEGTSWAITFRGSWNKNWKENTEKDGTYTLTNGRIKI